MKRALIVVDLQNDFLPGGALGVPGGDKIIPVIDKLLHMPFDVVIASKDYHPDNHTSFASQHDKTPGDTILLQGREQILWPDHCIEGEWGSEFCGDWDQEAIDHIVLKGTDRLIDSYSTFFDNFHAKSTGLDSYLREKEITSLTIVGLTTDYCVKFTTFDALALGYKVTVVTDGCCGVNLHEGDDVKALNEMQEKGATLTTSNQLKRLFTF